MEEVYRIDEPVSASAEDADEVQSMLANQLQRIRDYGTNESSAISSRNAALRLISADLMEIESYVAQAVRDATHSGPLTINDLDTVEQAVDMVTRLAKQIAQLVQLESRSPSPSVGIPYPARDRG